VVKNSAVVVRETKVVGSAAGVGVCPQSCVWSGIGRTWRAGHRDTEMGKGHSVCLILLPMLSDGN